MLGLCEELASANRLAEAACEEGTLAMPPVSMLQDVASWDRTSPVGSCPLKDPESIFYPMKVEILMCRFLRPWRDIIKHDSGGATPEKPQSPSELGSDCGIVNIESEA